MCDAIVGEEVARAEGDATKKETLEWDRDALIIQDVVEDGINFGVNR